jgi:hypothetical protein
MAGKPRTGAPDPKYLEKYGGDDPESVVLTATEMAVVQDYILNGFDKRRAYFAHMKAPEKTKRVAPSNFFARPHIKAEVNRLIRMMSLSDEEVVGHLEKILLVSMDDFITFEPDQILQSDDGDPEKATVIKGRPRIDLKKARARGALKFAAKITEGRDGNITVTLHDKLKALEMLMKARGMLVDTVRLDIDYEKARTDPEYRTRMIRELEGKVSGKE